MDWLKRQRAISGGSPVKPTASLELREIWRTTLPGHKANVFLCDPSSGSLFASDGWGVEFPSLRVHRLSLATGEEIASVRTRHQGVYALAMHEGHLLAATDSRIFELAVSDLVILRQWEKGLPRYSMQLVPERSVLVGATWLAPTVGLFDLASGRRHRIRVGSQPLVFRFGEEVRVIAGFDGGMWTLDVARGRLAGHQKTPAVASVAAGEHIWATVAGRREGGEGDPPVWTKNGTEVITRLTGPEWRARASGSVFKVTCDDRRGVLWCFLGRRGAQFELQAISQTNGSILGTAVSVLGAGVGFCHVDPEAGIALCAETHHFTRRKELDSSQSTIVCYALPDVRAD